MQTMYYRVRVGNHAKSPVCATVDADGFPRDPPRGVRGEEAHNAGNIVRHANSSQWRHPGSTLRCAHSVRVTKKRNEGGQNGSLTSSIICSVYSAPSGMYSRATALNMSVLMAPGATPLTVIFLSPQSID